MEHHTIDRAKYDHCVRMDERGLVYGFSWYLDTVAESWDAIVLNDYDAVWPLPLRRKLGFKYFYRPYAVQQLGIFTKIPLEDEVKQEFVKQMQEQCSYADIFLNENQLIGLKRMSDMSSDLNNNYVLNLQTSYRDIYHGYKTNTRRNIKKANGHGLSIFENDSPDVLIDLFKHHRGKDLKLEESFYRTMKKAMYKCLHKGMGKVWTVYGEGNVVCAGAFFVETEKRATLLFTALSDEGKDKQAMFYLLNEYIILGSEKSLILDFEGSNQKSLARFYAGFGSTNMYYQRLKYNGLPLPLKWIKK